MFPAPVKNVWYSMTSRGSLRKKHSSPQIYGLLVYSLSPAEQLQNRSYWNIISVVHLPMPLLFLHGNSIYFSTSYWVFHKASQFLSSSEIMPIKLGWWTSNSIFGPEQYYAIPWSILVLDIIRFDIYSETDFLYLTLTTSSLLSAASIRNKMLPKNRIDVYIQLTLSSSRVFSQ